MIARVWHGWTTPENAETYQALLLGTVFPGIRARASAGFRDITLYTRPDGNRVEFVTTMFFDSMDDVRRFAGDDFEVAVVPPAAHAVLDHYDDRSRHYDVVPQQ